MDQKRRALWLHRNDAQAQDFAEVLVRQVRLWSPAMTPGLLPCSYDMRKSTPPSVVQQLYAITDDEGVAKTFVLVQSKFTPEQTHCK